MTAATLIDTNILVYRYDNRFPEKQKIAGDLLRCGIADGTARLPHQAIIEFVAAVTRHKILERSDALREAEEFLLQFPVLYPNESVVREAVRACAAYQLNWFDAHLWAYAEHYGIPQITSEDFQHDRHYGSVRIENPFIALP